MKAYAWIRSFKMINFDLLVALTTIKGANFKTTLELRIVGGEKTGY
jgi:hypothetical protein